jgi:hypothetical protein
MELIQDELKPVPRVQIWIWCAAFTFAFAIWRIALQKMRKKVAEEVNKHNITAADYTVHVSGLAQTSGQQEELLNFASHYGQVLAAFHLRSVGNPLTTCNEVRH